MLPTGNNSIVLRGTSHNHDGIVERALCFFHELLCTTADDDGASLGLRTTGEKVEPDNISNVNFAVLSVRGQDNAYTFRYQFGVRRNSRMCPGPSR